MRQTEHCKLQLLAGRLVDFVDNETNVMPTPGCISDMAELFKSVGCLNTLRPLGCERVYLPFCQVTGRRFLISCIFMILAADDRYRRTEGSAMSGLYPTLIEWLKWLFTVNSTIVPCTLQYFEHFGALYIRMGFEPGATIVWDTAAEPSLTSQPVYVVG